MKRMNDKWYGVTHYVPVRSIRDNIFTFLWKKLLCHRGWHLFDECMSLDHHDLHCDACGLTVPIEHKEK